MKVRLLPVRLVRTLALHRLLRFWRANVPVSRSFSSYALLLALALCIPSAARADEFDVLRQKWKDITTGAGYDTSDTDVKARLSSVASSANSSWSSMDKSPSRSNLWSDAASTNVSAHITTCYGRLRNMALAYATAGCSLYTNATLLADTLGGLDWMNANRYNATKAQYDNWWDWEIGAPMNLTDIAVLLYGQLSGTQITNTMNAVNFNTPTPDMTQANKVWKARVVGVRGCVVKDAAKIALARDAFSAVFPYVTTSDGFYRDGSFIQHDYLPYTAGYGASLLSTMTPMLVWFSGSTWAVTDPAQTNLYRWVYDSFEPIIYRGAAWDSVRGREISRSGSSPQGTGHGILQAILQTSQFAPPADAARMRSMVKYWAQSDTVRNFVANTPLPLLTAAKQLMADTNTVPRGELIGHYHFGEMDRVIHLRPGYGLCLSLSSSRIANFESINGENMRGWYTGDGMTAIYNADLNCYGDSYWPTVDAYRMPGTTVDTMIRTPPTNQTRANGQTTRGSYAWVGGAKLGDVGVAGMQLDAYGATLTAKKSWFMFENETVCLGAGITSTDSRRIETIVENRKLLTSGGTNTFSVNGSMKPATLGWSETVTNANWAHLAGNVAGSDVGYYFPQASAVKALREARTGSWYDVNTGGATNPITRNYLTLWFDHGLNPTNATYAYVLLPNLSASETAAYAASPEVTVLENSPRAQGVRKTGLGYTAVNFWNSGTNSLGGITVNKPCSVIARNDGMYLDVAVSDPTQTNTGSIAVEVMAAATGVVSLDAGVTVVQMTPTVKLAVSANGADGRSYRATLYLGKMQTVTLTAVADAYVENGTNDVNNYGTSTSLVVKNSGGSTLTREAYLRFDLSAQTNGLLLDAALRLTYVTCNGGDTQTVSAVSDHTWTERGIVWTNKPASGAELARWTVQTNVPATISATVGAAAKTAFGGPLDLRVSAIGGAYVAYASREYATATNRPQLLLMVPHPPPKVALTAPSAGAAFRWAEAMALTASASSDDGSVTNVVFFDGAAKLGQAAQLPYRLTVTNLAPGVHSLTAVAVDDAGATAASTPVGVTVAAYPVANAGKALTLKSTPVDIDLRAWVRTFATPVEKLLYAVGQPTNGTVTLLADGHTARFTPAGSFIGNAAFAFTATDVGYSSDTLLHYSFEPPDAAADAQATDVSGNGRDGALAALGTGSYAYVSGAPFPTVNNISLALTQPGSAGAARLSRTLGTGECNLSDSDWSFAGWFCRATRTDDDFIFYIGGDNGFSGGGDELQLYCAGGADAVRLLHYSSTNAQDLYVASGSTALTGQWHHVAMTFARTNTNAGVVRTYLDGALFGTATGVVWALQQGKPLVFGGHVSNNAYERMFNGRLDDLALFSRTLSSSEVATLASRPAAYFDGLAASNGVAVGVLAPASVPAVSAPGFAGGAWHMTVSGPSGFGYTVEASTNLTTWTPLNTYLAPVPPFLWSDLDSATLPRRFYRVRLEP